MASLGDINAAVAKTVDQAAEFELTMLQSSLLQKLSIPIARTDLLKIMWFSQQRVLDRLIEPLKTARLLSEQDWMLSLTEKGAAVVRDLTSKMQVTVENILKS